MAVNKKTSSASFKPLVFILVCGLLAVEAWCGWQVHHISKQQEQYKKDYSLINSVSFGLLSVDLWRDHIVQAATAQVNTYRLTPSQQADLRKEIEQVMHGLVDHAFAEINKPAKSLGGKIKKLAINTLVSQKNIQKEVPGFANKIMVEVTKSSSYHRLANIADTAIAQLGQETYDSSMAVTKHTMDSVYSRYGVHDKTAFESRNASLLVQVRKQTYAYAFGMLGCILLLLGTWWLVRNQPGYHKMLYLLSVGAAVILLLVGLTTTMIEIDARIASMDFHLLGQTISFKNQELFFQSKSILDVVILLIKTKKIDSQIVGVMILIFSVIFPFMKLTSTGIALVSEDKWAKNKYIHYFAFKSGKWSMADVMVVAILMTYIGFNGIVESTLSGLDMDTSAITSITTNNTSIQPGYIIFIGFVLYGFVLSAILKKITRNFTEE